MNFLLFVTLFGLSLAAELNTYKEYLVFAAKNHYKSVTDFANAIGLQDFDNEFNDFKIKFNRNYSPEEEDERKYNFLQSLQYIRSHNKKYENRDVSHEVGLNQFADWSPKEYSSMFRPLPVPYNGTDMPIISDEPNKVFYTSLPDSFDWRQQNKVTPVKNQGSCGSCWAFATIATIESAFAIKSKQFISLSEQQLVDCCNLNNPNKYVSFGCNGGLVPIAMKYIHENGLEYQNDYPYRYRDQKCMKNDTKIHLKISGFKQLPEPSTDEQIMQAIFNNGPVAVYIDAEGEDFKLYRGGIMSSAHTLTADHYVTCVGWGPDYWIIKNSWGTDWGEAGFGRLAKGKNIRGFNKQIVYPIL